MESLHEYVLRIILAIAYIWVVPKLRGKRKEGSNVGAWDIVGQNDRQSLGPPDGLTSGSRVCTRHWMSGFHVPFPETSRAPKQALVPLYSTLHVAESNAQRTFARKSHLGFWA